MDKVVGTLALAAFVAFLAVVVGFVPVEDLIIVFVLVACMAGYDFWRTLRRRSGNNNRRA
jgi:membrane protein implicated in regulation of membrane protease activity